MKRRVFSATLLAVFIVLVLGAGSELAAKPGLAVASGAMVIPAKEYKTAPADLPSFTVERRQGEIGDGYLFVSMFKFRGGLKSYHLILDDNGEPVYYQPLDTIRSSNDFKKQPNGLLTYFSLEEEDASYIALNNQYEKVREIRAVDDPETGKAYTIDNHGLQMLGNGHALYMVHDSRIVDLSGVVEGGNPEAEVIGCIIQEVDGDNDLVFQWSSWDHIPITDTQIPLDREPLSYIHCNSIEEDSDGNLLVSNRNMHEVTKISHPGGEIMWRMGGPKNEFTFLNGASDGFTFQHDARRQANGNITIYDNANAAIKMNSRGLEYHVDEINKTVEKVTEFRNTPESFGQFMGNLQRLPNGNTLIGWGTSFTSVFTEFDDSGDKVLEFSSVEEMFSYRAFRFPWQGFPQWAPKMVAINEGNTAHLYFSWNGSTETAAFFVAGGQDPNALSALATVPKVGFETEYSYEMLEGGLWYFQVRPVSHEGVVGPPSNVVMVLAGGEPSYLPLVRGQ